MASNTPLWWAVLLIAVVVSVIAGGVLFSTVEVVEKPVVIKETEIKVVEIPTPGETKYEDSDFLLDRAIADFFEEIDRKVSLQKCDGDLYDLEQISVSRIDEYQILDEYQNQDGEYTVEFSIRLKYLDSDVEEKCYEDYDVEVEYDNDSEEPLIS